MGRVIVRQSGDNLVVEYQVGTGKGKATVYAEELPAADMKAAEAAIAARVDDIRKQVNPKRYTPAI